MCGRVGQPLTQLKQRVKAQLSHGKLKQKKQKNKNKKLLLYLKIYFSLLAENCA